MNVTIVERPEMKAAVLRIPRDGNRVREAFKEVYAKLDGHPSLADRENGLVFIPEWQWETEVVTLWVGVEVKSFDSLPHGLETITILPRKFAKISVNGDRNRMNETYHFLSEWFRTGPFDRDRSEGSLGYEMNRLQPINPFEIPADQIDYFEFDIYAPIKEQSGSASRTGISNAFPGIVNVEVRKGQTRKIVGFEVFMDRSVKPEEAIPGLWAEVFPRLQQVENRKPPFATIGLYEYKPPFGPGQPFNYVAGVEVEAESFVLPEGLIERTIPEGDTVVITYRGTASGLGQVWDYFHGVWFPQQSEYDVVDDFEFERHDHRYIATDHPESVMELHFPVRKRSGTADRLTDKIVHDEKGGHVLQDLRGAKVHMASFQAAQLHGIDMRDASLRHVNFVNSSWEHIYFSNVHVNMTQLGGTVFENVLRPDAPVSRFEEEPGTAGWVNVEPVVFRNSDLSTAVFDNCDLVDVEIRGCRLEGMRIDGIPVTELLAHYRKHG